MNYTLNTDHHGNQDNPKGRFTDLMFEKGYNYTRTYWHTGIKVDTSTADIRHSSDKNGEGVWISEDAIGRVYHSAGTIYFAMAGATEEAIDRLLTILVELNPEEKIESDAVNVTFWAKGSNGGTSRTRRLIVPAWSEIQDNYTQVTRDSLGQLLDPEFRPEKGGQLILWHGEPGTGKTTALRALAREWKGWCNLHYIADPEKFFGSDSDYMLEVMTNAYDTNEWRLLVLEDTGELLVPDARHLNGQGLSRFLNSVDGLIGQGLKFMVLVTTNEQLGKLHPAVIRPGRCLSKIEFGPLKDDEIVRWLKANESVRKYGEVEDASTLAELYAATSTATQINTPDSRALVGFGG